ncbi:MAG: efflux RND transporter periplasmic adaptor subunit [Gemmatimonadetes bacterium]|nr:efflux RND transporter periplasmic adaptor subunit [Gemmatimonadota bacterium]
MSTRTLARGFTRAGVLLTLVILAIAVAAILTVPGRGRDAGDNETGPANAMQGMAGMEMSAPATIRLTADQVRTFGIVFADVEVRPLELTARAMGIVAFDETRMTVVSPKFGGWIERLHVDFTGKPVRAGEPIAEIYSPELVAAQDDLLLAARLQRSLAAGGIPGVPADTGSLVHAARQRLQLWDISDEQIDRIVQNGASQRTLALHAPASGVVVQKNVVDGQSIRPGETLYVSADLSVVWIEAELKETEAALARLGQPATAELSAFPGQPIAGHVAFVHPTLDAQTRALRVRIAVPNREGRFRPGMYATVRLTAPGREALTVPTSAVLRTGERSLAFIDIGNGQLLPREIETGQVTGELTEVLAGLEPGQRVVASAQYLLDSESNLADVMRAVMGQMNTSDIGSMDMPGMDMGADTARVPRREER